MEDKELAPEGASCIISTQEYLDRLLDIEIEISEKLSLLDTEDRQRILKQESITSFDTYTSAAKYGKEVRIGVAQNIKEQNKLDPTYQPIERFTTEMGVDGMVHIIRDKGTVAEAYSLVADKHNKEIVDLKEMSTREHYNRLEIIEKTEEVLPKEISKISQEGLYSMIKDKTTINSMFDNTYTTMKILGELDMLRERVNKLEMRQTITEGRLDSLGVNTVDTNKSLALKLKAMGYNNSKIALEIGVRRETVSRWLRGSK